MTTSSFLDTHKENVSNSFQPDHNISARGTEPDLSVKKLTLASSTIAFPSPNDDADDKENNQSLPSNTVKPKRSALFYPSSGLAAKSNQKPFSRSAAKRESVMALGSIGHLQHFYSKQGFASKIRPFTRGPLTLAIGHAGESALANANYSPPQSPTDARAALAKLEGRSTSQGALMATPESSELEFPLSPEISTYSRPPYPNIAKPVEADPEALRPILLQDLDRTCQNWSLLQWTGPDESVSGFRRLSAQLLASRTNPTTIQQEDTNVSSSSDASSTVNVLELISSTTKTVRSVRNYLLALPPESLNDHNNVPTTNGVRLKDRFKRQSSFVGITNPASVTPNSNSWGKAYGTLSQRDLQPDDNSSAKRPASSTWRSPMSSPIPLASPPPPPPPSLEQNKTETADEDPLTLVRKSALDVLSTLREMEEKYRLPPDHPDYSKREADEDTLMSEHVEPDNNVDAKETASSDQDRSRDIDLTRGVSQQPSGNNTLMNDVDQTMPSTEPTPKGFLYRCDLTLSDLVKEKEVVRGYLTIVDRAISKIKPLKSNKKINRIVSTEMTTPSITIDPSETQGTQSRRVSIFDVSDDDDVTLWLNKDHFLGNEAKRIQAFLIAHLPFELSFEIRQLTLNDAQSEDIEGLLSQLADGYVLCIAYNSALRQSTRPWGFIQSKEIHNLKVEQAKLEEKERIRLVEEEPFKIKTSSRRDSSYGGGGEEEIESKDQNDTMNNNTNTNRPGWTFRRSENLRVWAAALKLRYQIQTTSATSSSSSKPSFSILLNNVGADAIEFDARKVARKEKGWQDMLFKLILRWVDAVGEDGIV